MADLDDGSVISSNLTTVPTRHAEAVYSSNFSLKQGVVIAMYYPEDDGNITKKFVEYDVLVIEHNALHGVNFLSYRNCQVLDMYGTVNNFSNYTLQPATQITDGLPTDGAQVMILCVDGISVAGRSFIVGGRRRDNSSDLSKDRGQFYDWQFNGVNVQVNKDGEYSIEFKTPLGQDGKPVSDDAAKAAGTILKIDKDGKFSVVDNEKQTFVIDRVEQKMTWANENNSITIDKKNKLISISSSKDASMEAKEALSIKSGKDATVDIGGKMSAKAGGDVSVEAGGNLQEKAGGNWQVNVSGNATINAGGNMSMMAGGNAMLQGTINTIGTGGIQAAGVAISQCIGTGNLGAPVVSTIITGSATCFIGA